MKKGHKEWEESQDFLFFQTENLKSEKEENRSEDEK